MYWGLRVRQIFTDRSSKAVLIVRYRSLHKTACFHSFSSAFSLTKLCGSDCRHCISAPTSSLLKNCLWNVGEGLKDALVLSTLQVTIELELFRLQLVRMQQAWEWQQPPSTVQPATHPQYTWVSIFSLTAVTYYQLYSALLLLRPKFSTFLLRG